MTALYPLNPQEFEWLSHSDSAWGYNHQYWCSFQHSNLMEEPSAYSNLSTTKFGQSCYNGKWLWPYYCMQPFIPIHRISFQSWELIYFLISRWYLRERPKFVPSSVQQSIYSLLAWMIRHVISFFFKHKSLYQHKVTRINYMTYDIQCRTNIIKPEGPCCNIMLLANHTNGSDSSNLHHFRYASMLGVYHTNVIYTGPGMQNFKARSFQMLWVRWYEVVDSDPGSSGWDSSTLVMLCFPPLHHNNSFGFVDLEAALRGCHILQAFDKGERESNINVSCSAKDNKDYLLYYVGR